MVVYFSGDFCQHVSSNDVTVLTLVPLYLRVAKKYQLPEILPVTLIGMAANFGSAFTPFGNTHNIFLMHQFEIDLQQFFSWSIPLLGCSFLVLVLLSLFLRNVPVPKVPTEHIHIQMRPTLFAIAVACGFCRRHWCRSGLAGCNSSHWVVRSAGS